MKEGKRTKHFFALASLTAIEVARQPISLLLLATSVVLIGLAPLLLMHNFGENGKMVRDSALAIHFVFGIILTGYAASTALAREIKKGTVSAVLSKPVGRSTLLLAKFAGVASLVFLFSVCCTMASMLGEKSAEKFYATAQLLGYSTDLLTGGLLILSPFAAFAVAGIINFLLRKSFESASIILISATLAVITGLSFFIDETGSFVSAFAIRIDLRLVPASALIFFALLIFASIAITLSTRLKMVPTMTIMTGVFILGFLSEYLVEQIWFASSFSLLLKVIPDWQAFWMCDALSSGGVIPLQYLFNAAVYTVSCVAAVLCIGTISFDKAEIG